MRDRRFFGQYDKDSLVVSIPEYHRLISPTESVNGTRYERAYILLKDPSNKEHIKKITQEIRRGFTPRQRTTIKKHDYHEDDKTMQEVGFILNITFGFIILIIMFLCFFSLYSSMTANLMEQTKEIGILRAMGLQKYRIQMLYFYEAFILVISSCVLGVMIGIIVSHTMSL